VGEPAGPLQVAPGEDVPWVRAEGIRYQRPGIVLLHKAERARPKDGHDLRTRWPALETPERSWLVEHVLRLYPEHRWLALMDSLATGSDDPVRLGDGPAGRPS
jgi:hypothetical protein